MPTHPNNQVKGAGNVHQRSTKNPSRQQVRSTASKGQTSMSSAGGDQLIGFYCLLCGYLPRAENRQPSSAPMCAGAKAGTGKQHEPVRMAPLFLGGDGAGPPRPAT